MNMQIYTLLDVKAEAYNQPWYSQNDETAKRQVVSEVQNPASHIGQFREDFILYRIGWFDEQSGEIHPEQFPLVVAKVIDLTPANTGFLKAAQDQLSLVPQGGE